jgi:hypothetical protein
MLVGSSHSGTAPQAQSMWLRNRMLQIHACSSAINFVLQTRQMGTSRRIAKQIDLGRLAQTEHPRIVVDLDAAGLSRLRKKFGVGATYQQGVQACMSLPARLDAEKSDRSSSNWMVVGHGRLAEQGLAQPLGHGNDLFTWSQRQPA